MVASRWTCRHNNGVYGPSFTHDLDIILRYQKYFDSVSGIPIRNVFKMSNIWTCKLALHNLAQP